MLRARILLADTRNRRARVQTRRAARWLHTPQPRRARSALRGSVWRHPTFQSSLAAHARAEARLAIQIRASSYGRLSVESRYREGRNVDRGRASLPEYSKGSPR